VSLILSSLKKHTLTLQFNRPEKANAFNREMVIALQSELQRAAAEDEIRCVMLTGAGKSFSAGQDIAEMAQAQGRKISYREHLRETYNPLILQIRHLEKPVIAAINGTVAGAGLGIALACDLRIAAEDARFRVGFTALGLVPDSGVSLLLPALIGLGRATELTFSNQPVSARDALAWGMVNRLVSAETLTEAGAEIAATLALGATQTFGASKRAFNRAVLPRLEEVLAYEGDLQEECSRRDEHKIGVAAFLKKEIPDFLT
jgi:2-(1,2-epoxy-1,2-dihydrophenyl)acetyl-CoA isomerase